MRLQGATSDFVRCLTPRRRRLAFAGHAAISARRLSRFPTRRCGRHCLGAALNWASAIVAQLRFLGV